MRKGPVSYNGLDYKAGYYPFGITMNGREFTSDKYRYGFNGMEKDNEVKPGGGADGNSYDFGARLYDSRLGRFLTIDRYAKDCSFSSPYSFAMNKPIFAVDANGDSLRISNAARIDATEVLFFATRTKSIRNFMRKYSEYRPTDYFNVQKPGKMGKYAENTDIFIGTEIDNPSVNSPGLYAMTDIEILDSDGQWKSLESGGINNIDAAAVNKNTKIRIRFDFNTNMMGTLGVDLETFNHEFNVHLRPYEKLIKKLRKGKIDGAEFVDYWNKVSARGKYNNGRFQHYLFGKNGSRRGAFAKAHRQLSTLLGKYNQDGDAKDMQKEADKDVKAHAKSYPTP